MASFKIKCNEKIGFSLSIKTYEAFYKKITRVVGIFMTYY